MTRIDTLLQANRDFAAGYRPGPSPTPHVAVIVCMDARIDPIRALGILPGDANIMRNAGGRLIYAIPSLVVSQQEIGTNEVAIIHHTDCGMQKLKEESLRAKLRDRYEVEPSLDFHSFEDLQQSVRDDLHLYRLTPFLRQDIPVRGFVYDVATGLLDEVMG